MLLDLEAIELYVHSSVALFTPVRYTTIQRQARKLTGGANLAKKKVFVSYDYEHDHQMKAALIEQAKRQDSPFSINDFSLQEMQPENNWISKAQSAIARCDVFIVLLGRNTHSAPGVLKEIQIAKGLKKIRFQLQPQGKNYGALKDAGDVVVWKWKNLKARLSSRLLKNQ